MMNLQGWLPARVVWRGDEPRVEWTLMGGRRLTEPFYDDSLQRQMTQPFHQLFRRETSMDETMAWVEAHPPVPVRGLIFHMSRCGSTLVSQQLAAVERNIMASEPPPLETVLGAHLRIPGLSREMQVGWVRAMVGALGQPRREEQALYIKLDCWNIHQMELIREAVPETPWIFLYRNPVEVMVSQQRMPGSWIVPGLLDRGALQLRLEDWNPAQTDVFRARALANICAAGLRAVRDDSNGVPVNYSELPELMYGSLLQHFGLTDEDIPAMRVKSQFDAKNPHAQFTSDAEGKRADAGDRLRAVVAEYLEPVYVELEAERQARRR
jgi:hypothetical protein